MRLVCWVLSSLYSIAKFNKPTPTEVTKFNLTGWESADWFSNTQHQSSWSAWVNSTWGEDLHKHRGDSWPLNECTADEQGRTQLTTEVGQELLSKTIDNALWKTCRGDFEVAGDLIHWALDSDYCDGEYPPSPPTPTPPTPTPPPKVWTTLEPEEKSVNFYMSNSVTLFIEFENGSLYADSTSVINGFRPHSYDIFMFKGYIDCGIGFLGTLDWDLDFSLVTVFGPDNLTLANSNLNIIYCNYEFKCNEYKFVVNENITLYLLIPVKLTQTGEWFVNLNLSKRHWRMPEVKLNFSTTQEDPLADSLQGVWVRLQGDVEVRGSEYESSDPIQRSLQLTIGEKNYTVNVTLQTTAFDIGVIRPNASISSWKDFHDGLIEVTHGPGAFILRPPLSGLATQGKDWLHAAFGDYPRVTRDSVYHSLIWHYFDFSSLAEDFELPDNFIPKFTSMKTVMFASNSYVLDISGPYVTNVVTYEDEDHLMIYVNLNIPFIRKSTNKH